MKYRLNGELSGIEVSFESKPEQAIIDSLKGAGFRWHRVKKIWYAKQNASRLNLIEELFGCPTSPAPAVAPETINLDGITHKVKNCYGSDFTKIVREELKSRGVKGVSVRCGRGGYTDSLTVTIKATEADIVSLEEYKLRYTFSDFACDIERHGLYCGDRWIYSGEWYGMTDEEKQAAYNRRCEYCLTKEIDFNHHHINGRGDYPGITTAFYNRLVAIHRIVNQWNYDNSDLMTDYFDVGYYLSYDIKLPDGLTIKETMTDEEKAAYNEELRQAEEQRAAEIARIDAELEAARKAEAEAEKKRQADRELIASNITVEDLPEESQLYITNLACGAGKECNLEELDESISGHIRDLQDAVITRKIIFPNIEAFEAFGRNLLDDFEWLYNMGGTGSDDVRLESVDNIWSLNQAQRDSIKWYMCNCVAVYVGEELKLICNPEGHNYCRYAAKPTENTRITSAATETAKQAEESAEKRPFYFPAPIAQQIEKLHIGQNITIYQCDGWILSSVYAGSGTISNIHPGKWAQYDGIYIELRAGRTTKKVFIRDNHECLIYEGIKDRLPDSITQRRVSENMYELLNYNELLPVVLNYYSNQGEEPILDTYQR